MSTLAHPAAAVNAPEPYVPTAIEAAEEQGYRVGAEGGCLHSADAFPGEPSAQHDGRLAAFVRGRRDGLRAHARRVGFDLGRDGRDAVRPSSVSAGFRREFEEGHAAGLAEHDEWQDASLAAWVEEMEAEAERMAEERDLLRHNRAMCGYGDPIAFA